MIGTMTRRRLVATAMTPLFTNFLIATARGAEAFPALQALPPLEPRTDAPLQVVTTNTILADIVAQIGGERVDARSLVPANGDPHDYEPSPDDLVAVDVADVVVTHGLGLDAWIADIVKDSGTNAPIVVASDGVPTRKFIEDGVEEDDPHIWMDPTLGETMAENIANGLIAADPDATEGYGLRLAAYQQSLQDLDAAIQMMIETIPEENRKIVTNHDALGYYTDRYGLTVIGTLIPGLDSTAEPSARDTAELLDTINENGVSVIFSENTVDPKLAEQLAAEAGVTVSSELYTDSLGELGSGAETYIGLLQSNTNTLVENLAPTSLG